MYNNLQVDYLIICRLLIYIYIYIWDRTGHPNQDYLAHHRAGHESHGRDVRGQNIVFNIVRVTGTEG